MKSARRRVDVNLDELDQVLDGARQAPLSESDYDKLKGALHTLAAMLAPARNTEKTSAVLGQSGAETQPSDQPLGPRPAERPTSGPASNGGRARGRDPETTSRRLIAERTQRIKILEQCFCLEPDVPVDDARVTQALQSCQPKK